MFCPQITQIFYPQITQIFYPQITQITQILVFDLAIHASAHDAWALQTGNPRSTTRHRALEPARWAIDKMSSLILQYSEPREAP